MSPPRVAFLALAFAWATRPALAAAAEPETPAELLRAGVELRKAHKEQDALAAFSRAYELAPSPTARAQMALARAALSDWARAEDEMAGALAAADDPWIARHRAELDEVMATIARHLGWLDVEVDAAGAERVLDGRALAGGRARVPAGRSVLQVSAPGYAPDLRAIDVPAEGELRVSVTLTPLARPGVLSARAEAPPPSPTLAPLAPIAPAPLARAPSRTAPLVIGATGLAAVGVGSYFGLRAFADKEERDANCTGLACNDRGMEADADGRTSATVASVTIGVGLTAIATSVAWLVLSRSKAPPPVAIGRTGVAIATW